MSDDILISTKILEGLTRSHEFARKTLPYLKDEYFIEHEKTLFEVIRKYYAKYNAAPTTDALIIELGNVNNLPQPIYDDAIDTVKGIKRAIKNTSFTEDDSRWLIDSAEKYCKDRALFLAISKSIEISNGESKELSTSAIPSLLQEALNVGFATDIGHDYLADAEARFESLHSEKRKFSFPIDMLNKTTKGGVEEKTLNVIMAPTGVGKSIFLCNMAAHYMMKGYDVLYITLEMADEKIGDRIDANLMDVSLDDMDKLSKESYMTKINRIMSKTTGRLKIKEYPTKSCHVGHIRHLLDELKQKKNFLPKILIVDYINLMIPQSLSAKQSGNSNTVVKTIAEELRGLMVEKKLVGWSATQVNREGMRLSDFDMEDTSESIGLSFTLDYFLALIQPEELREKNQAVLKQLKNRYGDKDKFTKFMVGLNKSKMRFFDLEDSGMYNSQKQQNKPPGAPSSKSSKYQGITVT